MALVKCSSSSVSIPSSSKICAVCFRYAKCKNYGAFACDACKMFFRRTVCLKIAYECNTGEKCFDNFKLGNMFPKCRFCRFQRCLECGMNPSKITRIDNKIFIDTAALIRGLMYWNTRRQENLMNKFVYSDPTLVEMVQKDGVLAVASNHKLSEEDWRFADICSTIDFFLGLEFMKKLCSQDRFLLLKNFTGKAVLFFSSYRAMQAKNDKLLTPSGLETVPEGLQIFCKFSYNMLCQIRSLLVCKLIELQVTEEEFLLVAVILFCDSSLLPLTQEGKVIIAKQQRTYNNALLHHCFSTTQNSAPSRYADLLTLCYVINQNFENVQGLTMIAKMCMPDSKCKQLFDDIMNMMN